MSAILIKYSKYDELDVLAKNKSLMCCCQSSRAWYLLVVSIWLLLTVIRQILDSIGRLWIPIFFNSFQVFSCICGLLAVIHWQKRLIVAFMLLSFTSILYNIALILWYNELFAISRDVPILSAGLSYSYSFFLRYTPSCKSYYNLTNFRWMQLSCIVPYYHIESAQALLHIFMANLSIILSIIFFSKQNFNQKPKKQAINIATDEKFCADHYFMSATLNNSKDYNQEYSKEGIHSINQAINEQCVRPKNGYIRHSAKKSARKGTIIAYKNLNNFQKPISIKRSQSMTDLGSNCQQIGHIHNQQTYEPINKDVTNASKATGIMMTNLGCVYRSGSLKNFKMPTTEGVRRILSREEINLAGSFRTKNACANSPNMSLIKVVEQMPHQSVKYSPMTNFLTTYQPNDLIIGFTANGCYDLTSYGQMSPNLPQRQFVRYSKDNDKNAMYDKRERCRSMEKSSTIDHQKSTNTSDIPIFNSNNFLV
uniref:Sodium/potassium-transporting ATPase subunit beta-1-interacting protein n=1 Tax=Wuchereria bancrofti TaxID=6293 RepID=A0A1I8ES84_WUCBA